MVEKVWIFRLVPGFWALCLGVQAQQIWDHPNRSLRNGNRSYAAGEYAPAMKSYSEALSREAGNPTAHFNLGAALYRSGKQDSAAYHFNQAASSFTDPQSKSLAHYNLGNTFLHQKKWKEGIEQYIASLKANPQNPSARYNLAYALKMMQQQQQQQQQQQNQDQKKDQQQDQQDQQQQQQQQQQNQEQSPSQQPPPSSNGKQMTREEAERMLDALDRREAQMQKDQKQPPQQNSRKPQKDW